MAQDNETCMLLENHGRALSSKWTRHMNIRYFFITDHIKNKELVVKWCPTQEMIGDFFTKPLQGNQFKKFRDLIMNNVDELAPKIDDPVMPKSGDPSTNSPQDHRSVLGIKERSNNPEDGKTDDGWTEVPE
eukprot:scaffold10602_cov56-Attheya_sp.AAC.1